MTADSDARWEPPGPGSWICDRSHTSPGPTLLLVPTSLIGNWTRELERFSPGLRVMVHHGPEREVGQHFVPLALDRSPRACSARPGGPGAARPVGGRHGRRSSSSAAA